MAVESVPGIIAPSEMTALLNATVCRATVKSNYITSFICTIDTVTNTMRYTNAGHLPPLLHNPAGNDCVELNAKGIPLGLFSDMAIEEKMLQLKPGDRILLYTDGIIECTNSGREIYGINRLKEYLRTHRGTTPESFIEGLVRDLNAFSGSPRFDDDLTLVVLDVE